MVHETTLEEALAEKANGRGHSTTLQAATVAKQAGAKRLIATHFSSRYLARDMARLLAECQRIFLTLRWRTTWRSSRCRDQCASAG